MARSDSSYIYRQGLSPEVKSVVSQKAKIFSYKTGQEGFTKVGAIGSFDVNETRNAAPVRGVGCGDTIAELVPQYTEPTTIQVNRTALQLESLYQVFGYLAGSDGLVRSLKHHQWPFDIKVEEVLSELCEKAANTTLVGVSRASEGGSRLAVVTYYEGCWLTSSGKAYNTDANLVTETCNISVTDVTDGRKIFRVDMNTGNRLRSRLYNDVDSVNRLRNAVGEAADIFGILR